MCSVFQPQLTPQTTWMFTFQWLRIMYISLHLKICLAFETVHSIHLAWIVLCSFHSSFETCFKHQRLKASSMAVWSKARSKICFIITIKCVLMDWNLRFSWHYFFLSLLISFFHLFLFLQIILLLLAILSYNTESSTY